MQIYSIPPLIPFPKDIAFGNNQTHKGNLGQDLGCSSSRVRRAVSRLDLEDCSFNFVIDNESFESVPNLESSYEYVLNISEKQISVVAKEEWGALAAVSTLAQLRVGFGDRLPECKITDGPKHPWRGLLVDVARHFIKLSTLYRCCDLMHHFKMNVLHLHLSDDQGFRFGSEQYPELVSSDHYSLGEISQLVTYAADLGIRVVPELDVPGHTSSWLVQHPEWGLGAVNENELIEFGSHPACLDPSNPETMKAVLTLFQEVAQAFPDEYIHVGGDEVDPSIWESSSRVQLWAAGHQLKNVRDIQTHFTLEICKRLFELNKKPVVWDEALHEMLPTSITVQAWRGSRARESSVASGYATIVSAPYYLDLHYPACLHYAYSPGMSLQEWQHADAQVRDDPRLAHVANGVRWHQDFGEFPDLPARKEGVILGGEACMWSELVSDELLLTRVWTRTPAIAERFWSELDGKDVDQMYERLCICLKGLPKLGLPDVSNLYKIHPCTELSPLFEMLEPVKWYARVLSMERVQARAEGRDEGSYSRPYNQHSPLNRVVDRIPPESLVATRLIRRIKQGEDLTPWIHGWQIQHTLFDKCVNRYPDLAELRPASAALAKLADVALGLETFDPNLLGPFGEYLLPVATAFADDT